jgi:predicted O-methyltransferase YrrM
MRATLRLPAVVGVLERIATVGAIEDAAAMAQVKARRSVEGRDLSGRERAELSAAAPLAVARDVGELLYVLARGSGARTIVEFGTSLGFSTIHLAAAIRDAGHGIVITSELHEGKARQAERNLAEAGLGDLVEVRVGDACATLANLSQPVDLLFLDGWNELYLPVLDLLAPQLGRDAIVIADLSANDPASEAYAAHVNDAANGFVSICLPLDDGVILSMRSDRQADDVSP